ncbi:hypothetical protein OXB_1882 [Bacillus sp. OxB-1]|uniref:hypothetical protein n=1 Tax=Bacillus sp. (strain OxB-1) TaxID=98228 RepID=UPI000581F327|nr:hypothetical protein [Bacillus sp. OxB-1]BAQ10353.1 hypothetical protein OXB_1882 [Bacillus sp. OxB-1]
MDSLLQYVKSALRRLQVEKSVHRLQGGLFAASATALLIVAVSRLFVWPHYLRIAAISAGVVLVGSLLYLFYRRVKRMEAIRKLDAYLPDNLLLTALTVNEAETHLASALVRSAETEVADAFERFKKREKHYLNGKMLAGFGVATILLAVLILFPSEAQREAEAGVKEKEIVEELKKEVKELAEKEPVPEAKKELDSLVDKLQELKIPEEVLREVVKKQKELKLQEQDLAEKSTAGESDETSADQLSEEELEQLKSLAKLADALARNVGKAQTALNKIGKAPSLPALASGNPTSENSSSGNSGSQSPAGESGSAEGHPGAGAGEGDSQSEGTGQSGQNPSSGQGTGQGSDQGQGNSGQGQGNAGSGQGTGQGTGQGNGQGGTGSGFGGAGTGNGQGAGAGTGSGGRTLLSIPFERVGEKSDPSIVKGEHGKGDFIEERSTDGPVEKGSIRPYPQVVGDYKESYLQSTDKLQLPSDLQNVLSDYFSSIE